MTSRIRYFRIPYNTLCLAPKFYINYCLQFLLGRWHDPRGIMQTTVSAKFWGANKVYYGGFENSECRHWDFEWGYYTGIVLMQKSCIFTQIKSQQCIFKILMRPRMQDLDLKKSLHLLWIVCRCGCLSDILSAMFSGFSYAKEKRKFIARSLSAYLPVLCLLRQWTVQKVDNMGIVRQMAKRVLMAANLGFRRWCSDDL